MDKVISRQYFNNAAASWDMTARNNDPDKLKALAARLAFPADSWVLDVGTGTGVFLPYISASLNGKSRLISLDYAINMLALASRKQTGRGVQFVCAEIETLHFSSELFDCVICYSTFPHFHDKSLALRNIHTILKPGGLLYICHSASRATINFIHSGIPGFLDHLIPEDDEMASLLESSGFTDYAIQSDSNTYLITAHKHPASQR